jgi:hypothetical protein
MQLDCVLPFEDLILEGMNVKVCTFPDGEDLTVLLRRRLMMIYLSGIQILSVQSVTSDE